MSRFIENYIAEDFGVTLGQAVTLIVLAEITVMDYEVVEHLNLYPRSKMRANVINPLISKGWIQMHTTSTKDQQRGPGAPRIAWSLKADKKKELELAIKAAQALEQQAQHKARMASESLMDELNISAGFTVRHQEPIS